MHHQRLLKLDVLLSPQVERVALNDERYDILGKPFLAPLDPDELGADRILRQLGLGNRRVELGNDSGFDVLKRFHLHLYRFRGFHDSLPCPLDVRTELHGLEFNTTYLREHLANLRELLPHGQPLLSHTG